MSNTNIPSPIIHRTKTHDSYSLPIIVGALSGTVTGGIVGVMSLQQIIKKQQKAIEEMKKLQEQNIMDKSARFFRRPANRTRSLGMVNSSLPNFEDTSVKEFPSINTSPNSITPRIPGNTNSTRYGNHNPMMDLNSTTASTQGMEPIQHVNNPSIPNPHTANPSLPANAGLLSRIADAKNRLRGRFLPALRGFTASTTAVALSNGKRNRNKNRVLPSSQSTGGNSIY